MSVLFVILYTLGLVIALYFLFIWLNRGRTRIKDLVFYIAYSALLSTIITVAIVSEVKPPPLVYFPIMYVIIGVLLVPEIVDAIKGRQNPLPLVVLVAGVSSSIVVPYTGGVGLMLVFAGTGILLQACYFFYLRRYPFLNSMWLEDALVNSVPKVAPGCSYSTKPVVIAGTFTGCWVSKTLNGLSVIIKKDKAIFRITRRLHEELGKPNLKELCTEIAKRICEYTDRERARRGYGEC